MDPIFDWQLAVTIAGVITFGVYVAGAVVVEVKAYMNRREGGAR